eukprot:3523610-Rhodomonas_salina.1
MIARQDSYETQKRRLSKDSGGAPAAYMATGQGGGGCRYDDRRGGRAYRDYDRDERRGGRGCSQGGRTGDRRGREGR